MMRRTAEKALLHFVLVPVVNRGRCQLAKIRGGGGRRTGRARNPYNLLQKNQHANNSTYIFKKAYLATDILPVFIRSITQVLDTGIRGAAVSGLALVVM